MATNGLAPGRTGSHFLDSLSAENFNLLRPALVEVDLALGQVLCVPGDEIDSVWFPTTAILSVITILKDGRGVEACTIGHESAFGLLNALGSAKAIDRVIAQVAGGAVRMQASRLKAVAALSASVMDLVLRHAQANAAQVQQSVACNAVHGVEARLCRWLLMTQDRTKSDQLRLTQEFLGFMLGVQRTTVTQVARTLQSAGMIRYSRGRITIVDRERLKSRSCECYGSVLEKHAELLGARPFGPTDLFEDAPRPILSLSQA